MKRINFYERYPGISKEGIDFLENLLQLNPFFRLTLDQAIEHPFFDEVRKRQAENQIHSNKHSAIQSSAKLDFENLTLDFSQMRQLFVNELFYYQKK